MVPDGLRRILQQSVPWSVPWDRLNIVFGPVPEAMVHVPHSFGVVPHALMRVVNRSRGSYSLRIMGATIGDTVYLNMSREDLDTAAGLALAAHEMHHVDQMHRIPGFDQLYQDYAAQTPRYKPWLNPLELSAYEVEAKEYCRLVALGVPPGRWTPLGVHLWGCGGTQ